ncbi:MAG: uracil-DNA glycosylase [Cocleimonas sp.]|nr:uracil-DNA glycosylase [Cocleimonas sp.]
MSVTQQQLAYLNAMGIPVWVSRDAVDPTLFEEKLTESISKNTIQKPLPPASISIPTQITSQSHSIHQAVPQAPVLSPNTPPPEYSTENLFNEIDQAIFTNLPKNATSIADSITAKTATQTLIDCSNFDWQQLQGAAIECQQCELYNKRTQIVFGEGKQHAQWMIIGDAPKEEEDTQGRPFMDRSGILLDNMLLATGLNRASVYLSNTLKCRPPNNRDPKKAESSACYGYLKRQIELVKPSLILIVGRIATQHLLQTKEPLARLRGRTHQIPEIDIPVVVTYHPAYLLRQPRDKYKSWQDLKLAQSLLKISS